MSLMRDYTNPKPPLRAKGNLSYLQFIELVKRIWAEAHPKIPMVTSGADDPAKYPCIIYSLQLRKTHPNEPKMRYREEKNNQEDVYVVGGQRFQNIVYFQAIGEAQDVTTVEHLIEIFEDFMIEFIPVFKELGVSELVYARRLSDTEQQRPGANTVARTVSYMVTTEKVVSTRYERLKEIVITARTWLEDLRDYYEPGSLYDDSPRYHLTGVDAVLQYELKWEPVIRPGTKPEDEDYLYHNEAPEVDTFDKLVWNIPITNFRLGDVLFLNNGDISGFFQVTNVVGEPWSKEVGYTLTKTYGRNPKNPTKEQATYGKGHVYYVPTKGANEIVDEFKTKKPEEEEDLATPNS